MSKFPFLGGVLSHEKKNGSQNLEKENTQDESQNNSILGILHEGAVQGHQVWQSWVQ